MALIYLVIGSIILGNTFGPEVGWGVFFCVMALGSCVEEAIRDK